MAIKLTEAMLCLNCDVIFVESEGADGSGRPGACPACGSKCAWPLSRWIRPMYVGLRMQARSDERRKP